jgi:hypothetical protein
MKAGVEVGKWKVIQWSEGRHGFLAWSRNDAQRDAKVQFE